MGIKTDSTCFYYGSAIETLKHAFIECTEVVSLWKSVEKRILETIGPGIKIGNIEKIFGIASYYHILDKFILATKQLIYKNRQINRIYELWDINRVRFKQMQLEEYNKTVEGLINSFNKTRTNLGINRLDVCQCLVVQYAMDNMPKEYRELQHINDPRSLHIKATFSCEVIHASMPKEMCGNRACGHVSLSGCPCI